MNIFPVIRFLSRQDAFVAQKVLDLATDFENLTDEDILRAYADLLHPSRERAQHGRKLPRLPRFSLGSWLLRLVGIRSATSETIEALALGYVAFKRAPADLRQAVPVREIPCLYPEQVQAAADLCRGAFVQMPTGEGKTYAILPAAIQLLIQFPVVYIVCPNNYLAWRDAKRTRGFWDFFRIRVGLCVAGGAEEQWSAQVIYTTLETLVFRVMQSDIASEPERVPVVMGALILDEADAIVLDNSFRRFSIVRLLHETEFNWASATQVAASLGPDDIIVDYVDLVASLSIDGEAKAKAVHTTEPALSAIPFLVFRQAVELAYIATKVAKEGEDYVVGADRVYPINRVSGFVERSVTPPWLFCLEHRLGFNNRGQSVAIHSDIAFAVLARFPHLCGLSGTIVDNALEYMLFHGIFPITQIPTRHPRKEERKEDLVYFSREEAYEAIVNEARGYVANGRPVLVGTQNINDAEEIHKRAIGDPDIPVEVRLITGKNEMETVRFLEDAGQKPLVTIATQLAGRGVDIRISPAVRAAGGMALICLGFGLEARHDRQFVGRVGRHGDPCTVQFFGSLDDRLFKIIGSDQIKGMLKKIGLHRGEAVQHKWVDRAIRVAQRRVGRLEMMQRVNGLYIEHLYLSHVQAMSQWFSMLRVGHQRNQPFCSGEFLDFAVNAYLEKHLSEFLADGKTVTSQQAVAIVRVLEHDLNSLPEGLSAVQLESRGQDFAAKLVKNRLVAALRKSADSYNIVLDNLDRSFLCQVSQALQRQEGEQQKALALPLPTTTINQEHLRIYTKRGPKDIAHETIINLWADYINRRDSIVYRVLLEHGQGHASGAIIRRQVDATFERTSLEIARDVVRNLLHADHPKEMDSLFLADHHTASSQAKSPLFEWSPGPGATALTARVPTTQADLINKFLARQRAELSEPFKLSEEQVLSDLAGFLTEYPIETLRAPSSILKAIDAWFAYKVETQGIPVARARQDRIYLWRFLRTLREQGLIGPLPSPKERVLSVVGRLAANISDQKILLTTSGMVAYFALLAISALITVNAHPWAFSEDVVRFLDTVAFAGLFERKSLLVPVAMILFVTQKHQQLRKMLSPFVIFGLLAAAVSGYLLAALAPEIWYLCIIKAAAFGLLAFLLTRLMAFISEWLRLTLNFNPIDYWLAFTVVALAVPQLALASPDESLVAATVIATGAFFLLWRHYNSVEITLQSQRLVSTLSMRSENVEVTKWIRLDSNELAIFLALIIAWLSFNVLNRIQFAVPALSAVATILYVLTLIVVYVALIYRETDYSQWRTMLTKSRQQVTGVVSDDELRRFLRQTWRALTTKEIGFATLLTAAMLAVDRLALGRTAAAPVGPVVLFLGMLGATMLGRCAGQVYRLLSGTSTLQASVLDVSIVAPVETRGWSIRDLARWLRERVFKVVGYVAAILAAIQFLGDSSMVIETYNKIRTLVSAAIN